MLHESLYGYRISTIETQITTGEQTNGQQQLTLENFTSEMSPSLSLDNDLAMALRISEQEQNALQEELRREEEMLAEVLRLSLEEK